MHRRRFTLSSGMLGMLYLFAPRHANGAGPESPGSNVLPSTATSRPETANSPANTGNARAGHLFIIGGPSGWNDDANLLRRFVELTGTENPSIVILTAASAYPEVQWKLYEAAFRDLGVRRLMHLGLGSRADADNKDIANMLLGADGIFMTGGNQANLMAIIGASHTAQAMHTAFEKRGACIGGTSAGAAVMSAHMIAGGRSRRLPMKGGARLSAGLGFVQGAIIDQHFSERQRLGRLLSVTAQAPELLGVGIDEDTALVIENGRGLEVIGQGAVSIIDGRRLVSNFPDVGAYEPLEILNLKLHLLRSGARYYLPDDLPYRSNSVQDIDWQPQPQPGPAVRPASAALPPSLQEVVTILAGA